MATAKKTPSAKTPGAFKRAAAAKKTTQPALAAKKAAKTGSSSNGTGALKPIQSAFTKSGLIAHLAQTSGVDVKAARAVMASLEATVLASVHKKGLGSFTLPGLLKVEVINLPAKKKRTGVDPFTKEERVYAARPAAVRVKTRALKKLKDAAL